MFKNLITKATAYLIACILSSFQTIPENAIPNTVMEEQVTNGYESTVYQVDYGKLYAHETISCKTDLQTVFCEETSPATSVSISSSNSKLSDEYEDLLEVNGEECEVYDSAYWDSITISPEDDEDLDYDSYESDYEESYENDYEDNYEMTENDTSIAAVEEISGTEENQADADFVEEDHDSYESIEYIAAEVPEEQENMTDPTMEEN